MESQSERIHRNLQQVNPFHKDNWKPPQLSKAETIEQANQKELFKQQHQAWLNQPTTKAFVEALRVEREKAVIAATNNVRDDKALIIKLSVVKTIDDTINLLKNYETIFNP